MSNNPLLPQEAKIEKIKWETYDTFTFRVSFADSALKASYRYSPGQFNMVSLFGLGEAPISISSEPYRAGSFDHTIRAVGSVTKFFSRMKEGQEIGIRGPYGSSWPVEEAKGKNVLVVAGGIGLAPLRPFIMQVFHDRSAYKHFQILYGARTPGDMLYTDEFPEWRKQPDTTFLLSADAVPEGEKWEHQVGVVTTLFDRLDVPTLNTVVLTCGPEIMMKFVVLGLLKKGFVPKQIYLSLERRMKCGVALCGHCQLGHRYVCKDGPVFTYDQVEGIFD